MNGSAPARSRDSGSNPSEWGLQILGALAVALVAAVLVNWVLASFYGVDVPASIGFPGNDSSWCDTAKYAYGLHCWSDFTLIRFDSLFAYPAAYQSASVGVEQTYPISTRIVRVPFFLVEELFGFRAALLAFLAVLTACLFVPAAWASAGLRWHRRAVILLIGTVATAPFLVVWDRGNIYAFTVPLLLLVLVGAVRGKPWLVTAAAIAAATIKPQYGAIGLLLIALRYWVPGLVALGGSALAVLLPFLLLGGRSADGVRGWLHAASTLNKSLPLTVDLPQNVSFARLLVRIPQVAVQAGDLLGINLGGLNSLIEAPITTWTTVSLAFAAIVAVALIVVGPKIDRTLLAVAFLALLSLAPTLAYLYYLGFCIPVLAVIIRPPGTGWMPTGKLEAITRLALSGALVCALTPLVLPMHAVRVQPGPQLVGSWLPLTGTALFAAFLVLVVAMGAREMIRGGEGQTPASTS